jgi:hypothetical protein
MSDKDSLEEQNITNLISFFEAELRLVLKGAPINEIFKNSERIKLRKEGILGFNHNIWFITEKAKKILGT